MRVILNNLGYKTSEIFEIEQSFGALKVDGHVLSNELTGVILQDLRRFKDFVSCLGEGCFAGHGSVIIREGLFDLSLDYFNYGEPNLADIFLGNTLLGSDFLDASSEFGPNTFSILLDSKDFGSGPMSLSLFSRGSSPLILDAVSTRFVSDGGPAVIPLPASFFMLSGALVFATSVFRRRRTKII